MCQFMFAVSKDSMTILNNISYFLFRVSSQVRAQFRSWTSGAVRTCGATSVWRRPGACTSLPTPSLATASPGARTGRTPESRNNIVTRLFFNTCCLKLKVYHESIMKAPWQKLFDIYISFTVDKVTNMYNVIVKLYVLKCRIFKIEWRKLQLEYYFVLENINTIN